MVPFMIYALCATYRHPELLATTLAHWNEQDYPADQRRLLILDDAQTFENQEGENWQLISHPERFPTLSEKYNHLLAMVPCDDDGVLILDDDNTLFPSYVSRHAEALKHGDFSIPKWVFSDASGKAQVIDCNHFYHSVVGASRDLMCRIGGWPETRRADFDHQILRSLHSHAKKLVEPWTVPADIQYMYRWHTGHAHGQHAHLAGPGDNFWYDRCKDIYAPVTYVGKLVPKIDPMSAKFIEQVRILRETL